MSETEIYLGDGAYAEWADHTGDLRIFTSNGAERTNEITLGVPEFAKMIKFAASGNPAFESMAKRALGVA